MTDGTPGLGASKIDFKTTNNNILSTVFQLLPNKNAIFSNRVGIGTNDPSQNLSIQAQRPRIALTDNSGQAGIIEYNESHKQIRFQHWTGFGAIYDKTFMVMDSNSGNIGIGTTTPGNYRLSIHASDEHYSLIQLSNNANTSYGVQIGNVSRVSNDTEIWNWENGYFRIATNDSERFRITNSGNVGIGTTTPSNKLEVNGTIRSKEVKVEAAPWPDYVFEDDYELRSLEETEAYIQANKHLPEIPSAKEIEANGLKLGEMNRLLLKKIEELTLHQINMMKIIKEQQKEIETLKSK
ncbi:MAG: hypothetical protein AAFY41_12245 [Bacteroidota bacterium]